MRKAFELSEEDQDCLVACGLSWETIIENTARWIIFPQYRIPMGYNHSVVAAALRIPPSYPDDQIDMVYFYPALSLSNGRDIRQLKFISLDGKQYQRWSRHRTGENPWRPGLDNICTHLLQVDTWLARELKN
jgi:hypothetical protein